MQTLTPFLRRHTTSSFSSLCSVVSYSLQCVCNYHYSFYNSIGPFKNCHLWMQDFELVAYLFASLQEQQVILKKT
ncbi:hypothetical protein CLU79DRAFT_749499 [Phycomyces nitens]|nr:hypothetical protein CLU79DRAFT_749499 [Phycomyces nitens]